MYGDDEDDDDYGYGAPRRRFKKKQPKPQASVQAPQEKIIKEVIIPEIITVQDLANRMAEKSSDVIKKLMALGVMATINQAIDADTAQIIVEEMGHKYKRVAESDVEEGLTGPKDTEKDLLQGRFWVPTSMNEKLTIEETKYYNHLPLYLNSNCIQNMINLGLTQEGIESIIMELESSLNNKIIGKKICQH